MIAATANSLVRVLLGPECAVCATPLDQPLGGAVCARCWAAIPRLAAPLCLCCGDTLSSSRAAGPLCRRCERRRPHFDLARSAGRYEGSLRKMIHAFKYGRRRALAEPLAGRLLEAGAAILAGADAVVPVPLHPLRTLERGFNQADDLARLLERPVWRVLRRVRHGPVQASLPAGRRHSNVRRAYALRPAWIRLAVRPIGSRPLRNSVVVLIDDVMTTGATLEACSRVLKEAGVRRVHALTVARSVSARPAPPPRPLRPSTVPHQ